ncbi:MDR family MFS transporter [Lactobacillus sp. ESL0785]|uniref:MDR family MFS transporter n=1 Tax=unclassified Lactobacillus TaxID=2620435 RepID=UPI0023F854EB|nr:MULTISPECIES: MDR family MFS transporter [unclassified Lactobacillus]WEV39509.1 MDR family MFS transporter [Lactobacillus sp. ESL0680]WEV71665.1 MDR family MFS transporter [Lactobacillus sp. ESL0785]
MMLIVLLVGTFCTVLNQTLLSNALPKLMSTFNISTSTAQWLTTSFLVVNGIMMPLSAYLATTINTKWLYTGAMGIFLGGTVLAYYAPNFAVILIGRIIQAIGVGITMPLLQTIMLSIFPPEKRGSALGMVGIVVGLAPALGPTLSGWILDNMSWRALFGLMIPIIIVVIILSVLFMTPVMKTSKQTLDWLSVALSTIGFASLLYGFSAAGDKGWTSTVVISTLIIGFVAIALFVWRQLVIPKPFLQLKVFKTPAFSLSTILASITMLANLGASVVLPLYLQIGHGMTPLQSGLVLLPGALGYAIMNPITGKAFDAHGAKRLSITGLTIITFATIPFLFLTADTPVIYIILLQAARMFGVAMVMMPVTTAGMNSLPDSLIADGTASNNTVRQIASSIGSAIMVTLLTNVTNNHAPAKSLLKAAPFAYKHAYINATLSGYQAAFLFSLVFSVIGLILAFLVKDNSQVSKGGATK